MDDISSWKNSTLHWKKILYIILFGRWTIVGMAEKFWHLNNKQKIENSFN